MSTTDGFIAIDWGTTNRRIFVVDPDGSVAARTSDARGVTAIERGGFGKEIRQIQARFGKRPMLLAGMVGSDRGWIEMPYLPCPCDIDTLGTAMKLTDAGAVIVPGVSYHAGDRYDVMRGEETQLLGAIAGGIAPSDGVVCHPGTHAKWARIEGGAMTSFRTVMTGELFALLKAHSILAPQLDHPVTPAKAFLDGVARGLRGDELTAELFSIRARGLLGGLPVEDAASFASGLLIGTDLRTGLSFAGGCEPITLIGDPRLTMLYAAALEAEGRRCAQIEGEQAFLSGAHALIERLQ